MIGIRPTIAFCLPTYSGAYTTMQSLVHSLANRLGCCAAGRCICAAGKAVVCIIQLGSHMGTPPNQQQDVDDARMQGLVRDLGEDRSRIQLA